MFGDELRVMPGESFALQFDLQSVAGLKRVDLISRGETMKSEAFSAATQRAHVRFPLSASQSTWYALIVVDNQGHKAYSDPIWVGVTSDRRCCAQSLDSTGTITANR